MKMERRVNFLDFSRGWAISFVVMFHGVVIHGMGGVNSASSQIPLMLQLVLLPLIVLGSWASVFALISGTSMAYATFRQLLNGKTNLTKRLKGSLNRGLVLLIFHFLYTYFFITPFPDVFGNSHSSLIVGSIRAGTLVVPSIWIVFSSSALSMLAFTDIFVSITIFFICRNNGFQKIKRNFIILTGLGLFFLFGMIPFQLFLNPYIFSTYNNGNYFLTLLIIWAIGANNCIFPYVGYGYIGAALAMLLAMNVEREKYLFVCNTFAKSFLFISIISYPLGLWKKLVETNVLPFGFCMLNLSLQLMLFSYLITRFDFSSNRAHYNRKFMFVRRWGLLSLTSYVLEGVVANVLLRAFIWIFTENIVRHPLFLIFIFGPLLMTLWIQGIFRWQFHDFKYSLEWLMARMNAKKRNVEELNNLMKVEESLYHPAGYKLENRKKVKLTPEEIIELNL